MSTTSMVLEVVHQNKVYDVTVTPTDKTPKLVRPKRKVAPKIIQVETEVCSVCGALMFNAICMNRQCIRSSGSYSKDSLKTLPEQSPK